MSYSVVVFDWDGTLVDSEGHIVSSLTYAASQLGLPDLPYDTMKDVIGLGMREAILHLYPDLDDVTIDDYRRHYADAFFEAPMTDKHLFDDAVDVLERLKLAGLGLAVATGKSRNGLEKALDSTGLRRYFDVTKCADETESKPSPLMLEHISEHLSVEPRFMLMVGDTEFDLEMARRMSMGAVGVSYGVHDVGRLTKHKPLKIVDNLRALLDVVGLD